MASTATRAWLLSLGLSLSSAFAPPAPVALRPASRAARGHVAGVVSLRAATETVKRRRSGADDSEDKSLLLNLHTTTLKRAYAAPAADKKPLSKSGHAYEQGAYGEVDYDAPSAKLKAAGRLSVNQPPSAINAVFPDNEIDYDAPMWRQIAARGFEGRGDLKFETGAYSEIDYDAPSAKLKAAGRLSVNQPPSAVNAVFLDEIDYDAPMWRQIAARGFEGRGDLKFETGAYSEIDYDAPSAKLKAAGRLSVNQPPPAVNAVFLDEIDYDAPVLRS